MEVEDEMMPEEVFCRSMNPCYGALCSEGRACGIVRRFCEEVKRVIPFFLSFRRVRMLGGFVSSRGGVSCEEVEWSVSEREKVCVSEREKVCVSERKKSVKVEVKEKTSVKEVKEKTSVKEKIHLTIPKRQKDSKAKTKRSTQKKTREKPPTPKQKEESSDDDLLSDAI